MRRIIEGFIRQLFSRSSRANTYDGLRSAAMNMTPKELNLELSQSEVAPYGVLMELSFPNAVVTLASFATGDASLYFSTGGGVIGGVGHANVRTAAQAFVKSSISYLAKMQPTNEYPAPSRGMTRFYVLTTQGILTKELSEAELGSGKADFSALFFAGQDVITQLRLTSGK
jgi:hypothetical protein